jgi:predicted P-loop ATPase
MISAVARAYRPGCKVDTVLTLEGSQGKTKSTVIEALFGKEFFTDDLAELGTKDSAMQMAGVWCIEIADLAAMKRADVDKIKAFITRKIDRFRPPYGKNIIEVARRSILISTTNLDDWNKDETGGRRFWPVQIISSIQVAKIRELRDQLWAEAVACYRADEKWWLEDKALMEVAEDEVDKRHVEDPWTKPILDAVRHRSEVAAEDLLTTVLQMERSRQTTFEQARVGKILRRAGWSKTRPRSQSGRLTVYLAPADVGQGELRFAE